ncbi:hypothetical protein NBZ79_12060 [Sneathiella marina]|uniref:Lipoprotein n=1 Tax=Sneathiella marina TaxID=2950108 RepID=A0ABY4VYI8_9PROT|nr:hypothetical protein [Sneathiella marina]USG59910.1 hypothetical protein NBZ79_12060 [Sneathiella marina]
MKKLILLPLIVGLAACNTARDDRTYSCEQLQIEYNSKTEEAIRKYSGGQALSGEGNALLDQNEQTKSLADRKGCKTQFWTEQPERVF